VILDGDTAGTTVEPAPDAEATAAADESAAAPVQDLDAAELLTPENFDRDSVLDLLAEADELSATRRSSLRALVDGATASPEIRDATIREIRAALDLPPLQ
jgi:hypothetical protein